MDALFPPGRRQERIVESVKRSLKPFDAVLSLQEKYGRLGTGELISKAAELVFQLPAVGS